VESKADAEATDDAKCWCKELQAALDTRLRESAAEIQELEQIRDARFYENVGLRIEVKQHKEQVNMHSQSLDEAVAINSKAKSAHGKDKEQTKQALDNLRKALQKVPKGGEVHGALQGLEDKFASNLEDAEKSRERRQSQFDDVKEAKTEMMRLAKEGANMKMRRLADGEVVIAQAKSDLSAFNAQQEADYELRGALKSSCGALLDAATNREKLRQDTMIAISESKVKSAEKSAMAAAGKVMLLRRTAATSSEAASSHVLETLGSSFRGDCAAARERAEDAKRRADEALDHARKAGKKLLDLVEKGSGIQTEISKALSNAFMKAHLVP
jgi:hypothetical protein